MRIARFRVSRNEASERNVQDCLDSGMLSVGPEVERFEVALAEGLNVPYVRSVSSGYSALLVSIISFGLKDKNILVPAASTCTAIPNAVKASGNIPIFCDVDVSGAGLDLQATRLLIVQHDVKLIIQPMHFGITANSLQNTEISIPIIEDCAQTILSDLSFSRPLNNLRIYSFYPTKGLNAIDGGAIACLSKEQAGIVERIRYYGNAKEWSGNQIQLNCKMTNLNCAYGLGSLAQCSELTFSRLDFLNRMKSIILGHESKVSIFGSRISPMQAYVPQKIILKLKTLQSRDYLRERLIKSGIGASAEMNLISGDKSHLNSVELVDTLVSIPSYDGLSESEKVYILDTIKEILKGWN